MKKLMFIAMTLAAGISFADGYSPSKVPTGVTSPDVMPGMVNFQGLLRDPATGNPYADGIYTLECRLYTALTGTKAIWGAKYQAYVREGYFNIMLGSTGTPLSGCTYQNPADLWKALWYSGDNRELYLGVTPWQGADGQTIADADKRKEITPRQQLLAAPFALRAQKAQYADAAVTDFKVPGDLTVSGQIKNADGSAFGLKNVKAGDTELELGTSTSSPSKTVMRGKDVAITSGGLLNLNPGGDMNVYLAAGKKMSVSGNNGFVNFINLASFKAKADTVFLGWDRTGNDDYGIKISKHDDKITATAADISLEGRPIGSSTAESRLSVHGNIVEGKGELKWALGTGAVAKPFRVQTEQVTLDANTSGTTYISRGVLKLSDKYVWMVVGCELVRRTPSATDSQWASLKLRNLHYDPVSEGLYIETDATILQSRSLKVTFLGVLKAMCEVVE